MAWVSSFCELPFQDYSLRVRTVALGAPGVHLLRALQGKKHTLILSYDGELYACGCNSEGQLGTGCGEDATPMDVPKRLKLELEGALKD